MLESSFFEILKASGPVGLTVFLILLTMSIFSWAIILFKYVQLSKAIIQTENFLDHFFRSTNLKQILEFTKQVPYSPVAQMFDIGFKEFLTLKDELKDIESVLAAVERNLKRVYTQEVENLESWVSFLATTASTAPFIGLFGTVVGVMNSFHGLAFIKESTLQAVAPGIAEALLATAVGLVAAIPAALAYNYFIVKIKKLKIKMTDFIDDFKVMVKVSV